MPKVGMEPIRRKQVINATLDCVATDGFDGLTLEIVARKAGVSKGVVSYYFKGKDDLICQAFGAFLNHYNELITQTMQNESSALTMLERMIDLTVNPSAEDEIRLEDHTDNNRFIGLNSNQYFRLLIHYYARIINNDRLRQIYQTFYRQYLEGIIALIQQGVEWGEFSVVDPQAAAYSVMTQLDGAILYQALGFRPLAEQEVIEVCKAHLRKTLTEG